MSTQTLGPDQTTPKTVVLPEIGDYLHTPADKVFDKTGTEFVIYRLTKIHEHSWSVFNLITRRTEHRRSDYPGRLGIDRYKIVTKAEAAKILLENLKKINARQLAINEKRYILSIQERRIILETEKLLEEGKILDELLNL